MFAINGVQKPVITMKRGSTYTFNQSHSSNVGHPLRIKSDAGGQQTTTNTYNLGTGSKRYTEVYHTSQSLSVSASISAIKFENLPTLESQARLIGTGSLWLGGLSGSSRSNYLMVFTG